MPYKLTPFCWLRRLFCGGRAAQLAETSQILQRLPDEDIDGFADWLILNLDAGARALALEDARSLYGDYSRRTFKARKLGYLRAVLERIPTAYLRDARAHAELLLDRGGA